MAEKHFSDSIVIIPTYNEKENVEAIIRAVIGLEKAFDVLIIDDGSPDGTAAIVKRLMDEDFPTRLHLIERQGKLGLGTAYIRGFEWAIAQGYDYIFEMDADFSHNPADRRLPRRGLRRIRRQPLREGRERGELAYGPCLDVVLRQQVCPLRAGHRLA